CKQRKYFNIKRWYCVSRPQYARNCGLAALTGIWNFLFSTLGEGRLAPISQERVMVILGMKSPFTEVPFQLFASNEKVLSWFDELCRHFEVRGRGFFLYKLLGRNSTLGVKRGELKTYRCDMNVTEECETQILLGESSMKREGIHCKKWTDICRDLSYENPEYIDIRALELGIQKRKTANYIVGNVHCILAFQKL
ncbi:basic immunoglobulin-like variable motif-containing protein, partial [Tubulanus polymorphus]|uniref:basic immunoglobulin-like variable motif-containing protein n=1 Tax=Tubulanus polymorphus TaxID=672921 RepID=UPI003DA55CDA